MGIGANVVNWTVAGADGQELVSLVEGRRHRGEQEPAPSDLEELGVHSLQNNYYIIQRSYLSRNQGFSNRRAGLFSFVSRDTVQPHIQKIDVTQVFDSE